jgi:hypothetical protein
MQMTVFIVVNKSTQARDVRPCFGREQGVPHRHAHANDACKYALTSHVFDIHLNDQVFVCTYTCCDLSNEPANLERKRIQLQVLIMIRNDVDVHIDHVDIEVCPWRKR